MSLLLKYAEAWGLLGELCPTCTFQVVDYLSVAQFHLDYLLESMDSAFFLALLLPYSILSLGIGCSDKQHSPYLHPHTCRDVLYTPYPSVSNTPHQSLLQFGISVTTEELTVTCCHCPEPVSYIQALGGVYPLGFNKCIKQGCPQILVTIQYSIILQIMELHISILADRY